MFCLNEEYYRKIKIEHPEKSTQILWEKIGRLTWFDPGVFCWEGGWNVFCWGVTEVGKWSTSSRLDDQV